MKHYITTTLAFCYIFFASAQTPAQTLTETAEATTPVYTGLAMNGNPRQTATDTHLDYANPDAPKGGTMKTAAIGSFDTLNPYSLKNVAAEGLNLVYDRLMQRAWNEPFTLYPLIAKSADVSPDRSAITFHLNPAARFNDQTPITAQDVKFSFETLREKGRPNMRQVYKLVDTAEIKDQYTINFTLKPGYDRETVMILAMMPVLSEKWWTGRDFDVSLLEPPVSSGPYNIAEVIPGRRVIYERNPDYWAKDLMVNVGHYNFDRIIYEYFRDDTIALEAFKKGDLSLRREWDVSKWESAYADINAEKITRLAIPHHRPERAHGLIFNLRRPLFEDIRVRKALSLAFDGDWVGKNLYYGQFSRIKSFFPNSALDGSGEIPQSTLDALAGWKNDLPASVFSKTLDTTDTRPLRERLRDASALLKEAGWIIKDGKRVNEKNGEPLAFEILVSTPQEEKIALNFSKSLETLGISAAPRLMDTATFQNRINNYDYDMLADYWQNSLSPGSEQMVYWSCNAAKQPASFNYAGICNPALDHFAKTITDAKTYEDLTRNAQAIDRILLSEYISVPLFYKGQDYIAFDKNIRRPNNTPLYGIVTETWWIEP
ncbi:MAG: ABC transporter substrate-binding protein [Alphaproteobacteria bacterium]|nr:ABC transporter substrate-binding protein [Alphaproteobacteria bacterium]